MGGRFQTERFCASERHAPAAPGGIEPGWFCAHPSLGVVHMPGSRHAASVVAEDHSHTQSSTISHMSSTRSTTSPRWLHTCTYLPRSRTAAATRAAPTGRRRRRPAGARAAIGRELRDGRVYSEKVHVARAQAHPFVALGIRGAAGAVDHICARLLHGAHRRIHRAQLALVQPPPVALRRLGELGQPPPKAGADGGASTDSPACTLQAAW